jgi:hypothetical protein
MKNEVDALTVDMEKKSLIIALGLDVVRDPNTTTSPG